MLPGPAHDETVQALQLHAPPGHQIVMQGGEAARLYGLRQGQAAVLGGLRHAAAIRLGHRAYLCNQAAKSAQATSTVRISPIGSRPAAVMPACAQMKATLAHSTVLMLADNSASKPACSHQASRRCALRLVRPSSSPNVMLAGPPKLSRTILFDMWC